MKIYCIANKKGGIGKTTTATNLASVLSDKGYKTLLIDADPQCNSTDTYRAQIKDTATLYDVLLDYEDPTSITDAIQHTEIGDIVAADPLLNDAETQFRNDGGDEYFRLKDSLDQLTGYDYVIIDTAPADNKLLKNCLIAADEVIVPVTADRYGIQGLSDLNHTINTIRKRSNPNLKIAGLLMIKYKDRLKLAQEVLDGLTAVSSQLGTQVFKTKIRESTGTQQAQAQRTTVVRYDPRNNTAIDYVKFTDELIGD